MYRVTVRFYEELNDFLPQQDRKSDLELSFSGRRSIKDFIESMGVPHVEVDLILVHGVSVDFNYLIQDGDRISVYPVFERLPIEGVTRLRPEPLRLTRFVLDVHLRKLARRLRLLGFDTDYGETRDDPELAEISANENRILLTRDRGLLKRKIVTRGLIIRNTDPEKQVIEVIERLHLRNSIKPFTRCISCNGIIKSLDMKSELFHGRKGTVPPGVLAWCSEYYICDSCGKIYWKGSHYDRMVSFIEKIRGDL
jgi:uncharacterized protein with PIN domain